MNAGDISDIYVEYIYLWSHIIIKLLVKNEISGKSDGHIVISL